MSTKKSKITTVQHRVASVIDTTKNNLKNVNSIALQSTEELIAESFTIAGQWQKVSAKAITSGFKLASNQQDIVFDALDTFKGQLKQGKKRHFKNVAWFFCFRLATKLDRR